MINVYNYNIIFIVISLAYFIYLIYQYSANNLLPRITDKLNYLKVNEYKIK